MRDAATVYSAILVLTGADGAAPSRCVNSRCFLTRERRAVAASGVRSVITRIAATHHWPLAKSGVTGYALDKVERMRRSCS